MYFARVMLILVSLSLCSSILFAQYRDVPMNLEILHGIIYRTIDGNKLALDIYKPDRLEHDVPVVLTIHGGSWDTGTRSDLWPLAERIAGMGYAVVAIDYRQAPEAAFPAQREDAQAAVEWIRANATTYHFDIDRFFILGISAGGQVAGLLGTSMENNGQFSGIITISAPFDFTVPPPNLRTKIAMRMYLGGDREDHPDLYAAASPITFVTPGTPPFLILHGTDDQYIPPAQATRMAEALRNKHIPTTLLLLNGVGHQLPALNDNAGIELLKAVFLFLDNPQAEKAYEKPSTN